jgi:hypothetical protein
MGGLSICRNLAFGPCKQAILSGIKKLCCTIRISTAIVAPISARADPVNNRYKWSIW